MFIEKAGRNLYMCKFGNQRDKNRVTKGGPWSFDNNFLVFDELDGNTSINALNFRYAFFWTHFHGLPRVCFYRKYAEALGNFIGTFETVEVNEQGNISGETLRVRIKININDPIKRGTNVQIGSSDKLKWIPITYEKLLDFCYHCGRIGHVIEACDEVNEEGNMVKNYGVELRET